MKQESDFILLVDNDILTINAIETALNTKGYTCYVSTKIADAKSALLYSVRPVKLIICEFTLPDGTGDQIIRYAAELPHAIPGIGMSHNKMTQIPFHQAGAKGFLKKPIVPDELWAEVKNLK